ncbi:hypothetical protein pb186bvf_019725 [Paramecium bursaria]
MFVKKLVQQQPNQQNAVPIQQTPGWKRMQNDQIELNDLKFHEVKVIYPDPKNIMQIEILIQPDSGFWLNGKIKFRVRVPEGYPQETPSVQCNEKIFHPNIDTDGKVCLNILREDWKPTNTIIDIVCGLLLLLKQPNPSDPLNHQAAKIMKENPDNFKNIVQETMQGNKYNGLQYSRII